MQKFYGAPLPLASDHTRVATNSMLLGREFRVVIGLCLALCMMAMKQFPPLFFLLGSLGTLIVFFTISHD